MPYQRILILLTLGLLGNALAQNSNDKTKYFPRTKAHVNVGTIDPVGQSEPKSKMDEDFVMTDVFSISGQSTVVGGQFERGIVKVGDIKDMFPEKSMFDSLKTLEESQNIVILQGIETARPDMERPLLFVNQERGLTDDTVVIPEIIEKSINQGQSQNW